MLAAFDLRAAALRGALASPAAAAARGGRARGPPPARTPARAEPCSAASAWASSSGCDSDLGRRTATAACAASPQHVPVARAVSRCVEVLEDRLRVLAAGAELVAQASIVIEPSRRQTASTALRGPVRALRVGVERRAHRASIRPSRPARSSSCATVSARTCRRARRQRLGAARLESVARAAARQSPPERIVACSSSPVQREPARLVDDLALGRPALRASRRRGGVETSAASASAPAAHGGRRRSELSSAAAGRAGRAQLRAARTTGRSPFPIRRACRRRRSRSSSCGPGSVPRPDGAASSSSLERARADRRARAARRRSDVLGARAVLAGERIDHAAAADRLRRRDPPQHQRGHRRPARAAAPGAAAHRPRCPGRARPPPSARHAPAPPACRGAHARGFRARSGRMPGSSSHDASTQICGLSPRTGATTRRHRARPRAGRCRRGSARRGWPGPARSRGSSCTSRLRTRASRPGARSAPCHPGQRSRPQRPGHDRADPPQRERPVHVQSGARRPPARGPRGPQRVQRRVSSSSPVAAGAQTGTSGASRRARRRAAPRSPRRQPRQVRLDQSTFVRATAPAGTPAAQHGQVLLGLGHDAVVGGDHQQEEVDAARARDHRAHEALVPRHVHDAEGRPEGSSSAREAQLDRDAARAFLWQAVGVDARQRLDQRGLAVVDVAGGAERQRRLRHADGDERRHDGAATTRSRPRPIVRGSSSTASSCTRAITGGSLARSRRAARRLRWWRS